LAAGVVQVFLLGPAASRDIYTHHTAMGFDEV
jgi:hypothetical protein